MSLFLRQVALVASKLAPAIDDLSAIFGIEPCHVDPGVGIWGLENTLIPVGSNFLEVVAPIKDGTAAGRHIARRGGDGGYMVICQTESRDSQRAFRERAVASGVRVAYEGEREGFRIMQLHPGDLEAAFLEIDWDIESDFAGRWEPAGGTGWKSTFVPGGYANWRAWNCNAPIPRRSRQSGRMSPISRLRPRAEYQACNWAMQAFDS